MVYLQDNWLVFRDGDYIICEAQHSSRVQKVSDTLDRLTQPPNAGPKS